jgi:hypothetical protein
LSVFELADDEVKNGFLKINFAGAPIHASTPAVPLDGSSLIFVARIRTQYTPLAAQCKTAALPWVNGKEEAIYIYIYIYIYI